MRFTISFFFFFSFSLFFFFIKSNQRAKVFPIQYRSDIYLLDDPLSAVDAHNSNQIFEQVIGPKGMLKNNLRIMVTNSIQFLPKANHILVLKEGKVIESGSFRELVENRGEFTRLVYEFSRQPEVKEIFELPQEGMERRNSVRSTV